MNNLIKSLIVIGGVLSMSVNLGAADDFMLTFPFNLENNGNISQSSERTQPIKVISGVGHIKLQNLINDDEIFLYNLEGLIITTTIPSTSELIMPLNSGVYLVSVNKQYTAKTMVY